MALYAGKAAGATLFDLDTLDPATAAATSVGPVGCSITGLAFDPTDGTLYGISAGTSASGTARRLFTLDPATGARTDIGPLGFTVSDIAFDAAGNLFGFTPRFNTPASDLVTINKSNGAATLVGADFDSASSFNGAALSFHSDGTLYVLLNKLGGLRLYTCNPATGALVSDLGQTIPFTGDIPAACAFDENDLLWYMDGGGGGRRSWTTGTA